MTTTTQEIKTMLKDSQVCRDVIQAIIETLEGEKQEIEDLIALNLKKIHHSGLDDVGTYFYEEILRQFPEYIPSLLAKEKSIRRFKFWLDNRPPKEGAITEDDQLAAKAIPLDHIADLEFKRAGSNRMKALCPFHPDKNSLSFTYYVDQNSWWCYSCNEGGDVPSYIEKLHNCNYPEAIKILVKK